MTGSGTRRTETSGKGDVAVPRAHDVTCFAEHGWWLAPELFGGDLMAQAREHAALVCNGHYEKGEAPQTDLPLDVDARATSLRKIDNAWWSDRVIEQIATSPVIGRIAAMLLGVEEVYLWHDQLLWKPGDPGTDASHVGEHDHNVGWHQDKGYWTAVSTSDMLTAWVAFDDVTDDMGPLRFVDGSHRWGKSLTGNAFYDTDLEAGKRAAAVPEGEQWHEATVPMRAGQASFHHCKTIHGSGPNTSDRPRRSLAVHLVSGEATFVEGRWHANLDWYDAEPGWPFRGPKFPRLWPEPDS